MKTLTNRGRGPDVRNPQDVAGSKHVRLERWLYVAPAVVAAVSYIVFVVRNAVDAVYWDHWASVPLLHALDDGHLTFSQVWKQTANNRVVVPRAITLGVGKWFHFDVRIEIFASILFLLIAVVLLMLTQRRNDGGPLYRYAPAGFFLFSIVQWQTALWNVQMPRFLILALFALALFLLCRSSGWGSFALAAIAVVAATLSLLDGFLLWPAIALVIWFDGRPERGRRVTVWALVGLATTIVYFIGYDFAGNGDVGYVIRHPLASAQYFFVLLGGFTRAPASDPKFAFACGILMFGLSAWVVVRFWRSDRTLGDVLPVALVTFVLLFDVWTLLGRGAAGRGQALASRYTTYNLLIFVAAYFALIRRGAWRIAAERQAQVRTAIGGVLVALAVLLTIVSVTRARHEGNQFAARLRTSAVVLRHYRTEPASRMEQYLCPAFCLDLVRREAPFLEAHRDTAFRTRAGQTGHSLAAVPGSDPPRR